LTRSAKNVAKIRPRICDRGEGGLENVRPREGFRERRPCCEVLGQVAVGCILLKGPCRGQRSVREVRLMDALHEEGLRGGGTLMTGAGSHLICCVGIRRGTETLRGLVRVVMGLEANARLPGTRWSSRRMRAHHLMPETKDDGGQAKRSIVAWGWRSRRARRHPVPLPARPWRGASSASTLLARPSARTL